MHECLSVDQTYPNTVIYNTVNHLSFTLKYSLLILNCIKLFSVTEIFKL